MRKFDLSLRSSRSSYFATFRHQLTILSKTDALDEEKWLNMLGTFVKDWFRYESHFVHGRDSLVDILKERGLLSESDAVLDKTLQVGYANHFYRSAHKFEQICRHRLRRQNVGYSNFSQPQSHLSFCVLLQYLVERRRVVTQLGKLD